MGSSPDAPSDASECPVCGPTGDPLTHCTVCGEEWYTHAQSLAHSTAIREGRLPRDHLRTVRTDADRLAYLAQTPDAAVYLYTVLTSGSFDMDPLALARQILDTHMEGKTVGHDQP
jgi:hypothetical protein